MKEKFIKILRENQVLDSAEAFEIFGKDWIKDYKPRPSLIVLPESYDDVKEILKVCSDNNIAVVPSGGRTGLSGGATALNGEVVIAFDKLNKVIEINEIEQTITCQAGALTQTIQEKAAEKEFCGIL